MQHKNVMSKLSRSVLGLDLEAVDSYIPESLTKEFIALFAGIINSSESNYKKYSKQIAELCTKAMGLKFTVKMVEGNDNMVVGYCLLDANHPYVVTEKDYKEMAKFFTTGSKQPPKKIYEMVRNTNGGMFSGSICDIEHTITIGTDNFKGKYTAGNLAAGLYHELGHLDTFYRVLGYSTALNLCLNDGVRQLVSAGADETKIKIARNIKEVLPGTEITKRLLSASQDEATLLISSNAVERFAEMQSGKAGNLISNERMADQFVSRQGLGYEFADYMSKSGLVNENTSGWTTMGWLGIFLLVGGIPILNLYLLYKFFHSIYESGTQTQNYDSPKARLEAIRRDMIGVLRDSNQSLSRETLAKIDSTMNIIKNYPDDSRTLMRAINDTIFSRRGHHELQVHKILEALQNSELRVAAARIENM